MKFLFMALAALGLTFSTVVYASDTPAPDDAAVYFVNLKDGDSVSSPFKVIFGLSGMGVAPAGVEKDGTGHHHLFIDRPDLGKGDDGMDELESNIPSDDNHKHFGKGQTETTLTLPAGTHTLQLVLGDQNHIPHNKPVTSERITITVK